MVTVYVFMGDILHGLDGMVNMLLGRHTKDVCQVRCKDEVVLGYIMNTKCVCVCVCVYVCVCVCHKHSLTY